MKVKIDRAKCTGCGICSHVCPSRAITVTRKAEIDPRYCMDCGTCLISCPEGAIYMVKEEKTAVAS